MRARLRLVLLASGITLSGCASIAPTPDRALSSAPAPPPPTAFVPQSGAGVQTLYRNGAPYAALANPRGPVLVGLRPVHLAERSYVRLWLRLQNRQVRTFLIDPDDIYLERRARGARDVKRIEPERREDIAARMASDGRARSLLRKTAVPPGESLQGEVYFSFPAPALGRHARGDEAYAYDVTVHLPTPDGPKRIVLRPVPAGT